jgi:hypothetical protein
MKILKTLIVCFMVAAGSTFAQSQDVERALRNQQEARKASEAFISSPDFFKDMKAAAEGGDALSQWSIGSNYEDGRGVPQNYIRAYAWYSVAAAQGGEFREMVVADRDEVAAKLSAGDLVTAQALAAKCFESAYQDCE